MRNKFAASLLCSAAYLCSAALARTEWRHNEHQRPRAQVGRSTTNRKGIAMLTSIRGLAAATLFVGAVFAATPAFAQEAETEAPADITVSGYVTGVTDYRFRGLSYTAGDYAIQGSINVNHASGFYVGVWGSNLEDSAVYGNGELDIYGGWSGALTEGLTADVGMTYYVYPNGKVGDANYFEPYASLSTTMGPVSAKVGVAYAWSQDSLANDDNLYVYTDLGVGIPDTPISLSAHLGYTDGVLSPVLLTSAIAAVEAEDLSLIDTDGGFDYSVGATYNITEKLSVGVSYVGVEGYSYDGFSNDAVVGSVKLAF
jgi:uncharacterized protein (TIGR02001 family)